MSRTVRFYLPACLVDVLPTKARDSFPLEKGKVSMRSIDGWGVANRYRRDTTRRLPHPARPLGRVAHLC